jgi:hypothetical protein
MGLRGGRGRGTFTGAQRMDGDNERRPSFRNQSIGVTHKDYEQPRHFNGRGGMTSFA